jgi:hypothetical protein
MLSASTLWFSPCVRKRKKWGKKYPKLVQIWAKSIKNEARGTPWGGRGGQDGGRREGNQKTLYFWCPPGRLWSHFGATNAKMGALLDPTRFRRRPKMDKFRTKLIQSMKKLWPGTLPEKTSKNNIFSMPKQEARKGKKEVFAWYLLHFKRFRGVTKFDEKWTSKCHAKSMKIDTLGTIWVDCWDLGWFLQDLEFCGFYDFWNRSKK